jgi:hypothetical protein
MNQSKFPLTLLFSFFIIVAYAAKPVPVKNFVKNQWCFTENKGQLTDINGNKAAGIRYYGRQGHVSVYCQPGKIGIVISQNVNQQPSGDHLKDMLTNLRKKKDAANNRVNYYGTEMLFRNANPAAKIVAEDHQQYYENFYTANSGDKGITGIHTFKTVRYKNIYANIDLVLHIRDHGFKYEFIVYPGGNYKDIGIEWNGTDRISGLQDGGIHYKTGPCDFNESCPLSYLANGENVKSSFAIEGNTTHFNIGSYDHSQILTIDPYLTWGTYLGGSSDEYAQSVGQDNAGNVIIAGPTTSSSSIATTGAFKTTYGGNNDAFVSKFSSGGTLLWSTYYGGTAYDDAYSLAIDKYNNIFFTGATSSTSGIATSGGYQSAYKGTGKGSSNAYLVKLSPGGGRFWGTYFGGASYDYGDFVTLDASQNIYLVCQVSSTSGIASSGAYQTSFGGSQDESLTKYDSTGKLSWSTYYGGSDYENPGNVYVDGSGNAVVVGTTASNSGIATSGAFQSSINGGYDGYLASFSSSGGLNWGTYYGGFDDELISAGLTGDASGNIFLAGGSYSTSRIATTGAYQTSNAGSLDLFVSKFTSAGKLSWGTFYGGSGDDFANAITLDGSGNIYIAGSTYNSSNLATSGGYQTSNGGGYDVLFAKFTSAGSLSFCSYYGGSDDDAAYGLALDKSSGGLYIGGSTLSTTGVATSGGYQSSSGGGTDVFLSEFSFKVYGTDVGISKIIAPNTTICTGTKSVKVQLYNYGSIDIKSVTIGWSVNKSLQTAYSWTGTLKKDSVATVTVGSYAFTAGVDTIIAWTTKPNSSVDSFIQNDTMRIIDTVGSYPKTGLAGGNKSVCPGSGTTLGSSSITGLKYSWTSKPSGFTASASSVVVSPSATTTYYLVATSPTGGCATLDSSVVTVFTAPAANAGGNHTVCYGGNITLGTTATKNHIYTWSSTPAGFSSTSSNPTANPSANTTFYVTETDTLTGCFAYDNATITVSAPAKANSGGNKTICSGANVTLGGTAVTGHTYSWKSKPVGFKSTVINPTVNPTVKTTYYLTDVTTATGCTALDSVVVTINPLPVPNPGGNKTVCALSPYTLGAAAVTGFTYSWTSGPAGFTSTKSNPTVNPAAATTYFLTVTNTSTGCSNTDSAVIKTNPAPAVNAGGNHTICSGDNAQLGATATTGHTYSWTSKPAGFKNATSNPLVSPTVTTTYYVTETNSTTGCSATDSAIVTVNFVSANAGGNHTICKGSSITLGQSAVSGDSYSWSSSTGGFSSTVSNPSVSPSVTTTYYLTEGNTTTGCSKIDSAVIIVNPLPDAVTGSNQAVCAGASVTLGAAPVNNNLYGWKSKPAGFTSDSSNPTITPAGSAIYYLTETIQKTGCTKTDSVAVIVKPLPKADWTLNYSGKTTYLHATDSSLTAPSYKWTFGDGDTATGHLAKHLYQKNKQYNISLKVTGTNGCVNKYDSLVAIMISSIGQEDNQGFGLTIFPNPFGNTTTLAYNLDKNATVRISLIDITGKEIGLITDIKQIPGKYSIDITADKYNLEQGVYIVRFMIDGAVVTRQIVKIGY